MALNNLGDHMYLQASCSLCILLSHQAPVEVRASLQNKLVYERDSDVVALKANKYRKHVFDCLLLLGNRGISSCGHPRLRVREVAGM